MPVLSLLRPAVGVVVTELPIGVETVTAMLDRGPSIMVAESLDPYGRRMAVAHGIGSVLFEAWSLRQTDQRAAEDFALALLVPLDSFRRKLAELSKDFFSCAQDAVTFLSKAFCVPEICIGARLFDVTMGAL